MSTLINLADLLQHEIDDLYSAEEQIISALPDVIAKATDQALKNALQDHLNVTKKQLKRLDKVRTMMGKKPMQSSEQKGFFARLFGEGPHKCKGTEGLIDEAKKMMKEDLTPEVKDAAIIAAIQKIEHYEISGYGTAKAFALEISLHSIAALLDETLNEEYTADDALTSLAVHKGVNSKAERATEKSLAKNKKPIAKAAPSKPTVPSKPKFTHKKPSPSPMQKTDKGPQKNINAGKSRSTASDSNTAKDQNSKTQQSINKSTNGNQGNRNKPLASAPAGTNKNNNRNAQPKLANPGNKPGSPDKGSKSSTSGQAKSTAPGKKDIKSQPGKNEGNRQNLKSK